ncbi:aspartic proteinase 36-like [Impatiens glandulifera]|uniref:aspartic proteinase 36-like n=1 Tax=Impatiens glandulifera TaxID=253017 RepID=UPI001FB06D89|nr:aspartic proteinase 36-like [Impatiens glandulifera]
MACISHLVKLLFFVCYAAMMNGVMASTYKVFKLERSVETIDDQMELARLQYRDNKRHSRGGGILNFSIGGESDPSMTGLYYTRIKIGSPPREFTVDFDTGSDKLWLTCSPCRGCPLSSQLGIDLNLFNPASSYSASHILCSDKSCPSYVSDCANKNSSCELMVNYADGGNATGYYLTDTMHFDTISGHSENSSVPIVFGCGTQMGGSLTEDGQAVDGIIGFGYRYPSVISQLSSKQLIPGVFSHCLRGEGGGKLVLGEVIAAGIVYTPLVLSKEHYDVNLLSITVNGQPLPVNPNIYKTSDSRGTIVDSGTTLSYLVEEAYDPFISAINVVVSPYAAPVIFEGNQCYKTGNRGIDMFPEISFNFIGNASIVLTPKDYILNSRPFIGGVSSSCIGFLKTSVSSITILGDLVLKDKIVIYDLAGKRLGWVNYNCSLEMKVNTTYGWDDNSAAAIRRQPRASRLRLFLVMCLVYVIISRNGLL